MRTEEASLLGAWSEAEESRGWMGGGVASREKGRNLMGGGWGIYPRAQGYLGLLPRGQPSLPAALPGWEFLNERMNE